MVSVTLTGFKRGLESALRLIGGCGQQKGENFADQMARGETPERGGRPILAFWQGAREPLLGLLRKTRDRIV